MALQDDPMKILMRSRRLSQRVAAVLARPVRGGAEGAGVALVRRLYGWSDRATDRERRRHANAIACQAQCSACCHLKVSITMAEAIVLADAVGALPAPLRDRVARRLAAAAERLGHDPALNRWHPPLPCAFLEAGSCTVYDDRPFACRGHHSPDRDRCDRSHGAGRWQGQSILVIDVIAHAILAGLQRACVRAGLDGELYELHGAVRAAQTRDLRR